MKTLTVTQITGILIAILALVSAIAIALSDGQITQAEGEEIKAKASAVVGGLVDTQVTTNDTQTL